MKGNLSKRLLAILLAVCMLLAMFPTVHAAGSSALKSAIASMPALKPNNQYVGYPLYDANQKNFSNLNNGTYLLVTDSMYSGSRYVLDPYAPVNNGTIGASPVRIVGSSVVGTDASCAVTLGSYTAGANSASSAAATYTVRFQDGTYLNLSAARNGVSRSTTPKAITFYAHYGHGGMHLRLSGDYMLRLNTGVTTHPYFDLQKDHYTMRTDFHLYKVLSNQLNTEPLYNAIKSAEPYVKYSLLPDDSKYQGLLTCLESAVNLYTKHNGGSYTAANQTALNNKTRELEAELRGMPLELQTAANVAKMNSYAQQMVNANPYNSSSFTWDSERQADRWRYFNGLMMDALQMVGQTNYTANFYNNVISSNGTVSAWNDGHIDSIAPARGLLDLLKTGYAAKFQKTIDYALSELDQQISYSGCGGNFTHQQSLVNGSHTVSQSPCWNYWTISLDSLYMALPFLMECAREMDNGNLPTNGRNAATIRTQVYDRLIWICDKMYNSGNGLYHHTWSTSASKGNDKYWTRGMGWFAMAMVDVIGLMPAGSQKTALINRLTRIFDGMIRYQNSDTGMWYNMTLYNTSLTSGNYFNRSYTADGTTFTNLETHVNDLETSGSAMMAYAMMKAYNNGWVGRKYGDAGLKAFNGTVNTYMYGQEGSYVIGGSYKAGWGQPTNEQYLYSTYEADEAKGTAPLIMASTLANDTISRLQGSSAVLSGNSQIIIAKNGTPNYSSLKLVITYADKSTKTFTTSNGLSVASLDTSKPGIYDLPVSYDGISYGAVRVVVTSDTTTQSDGSVVIGKTASGISFANTGAAKVELTAKGSSVQMGVDVILVVDVSNSMAWDMDWFIGGTAGKTDRYRLPGASGTTKTGWYNSLSQKPGADKLDMAMDAASQLANTLLMDNRTGNTAGNNTLTFVTFAGHDTDYDGGIYDFTTDLPEANASTPDIPIVDSVQTVFSAVEQYADAKRSFDNTYFYKTTAGQFCFAYDAPPDTEYYLQIAGTDGQSHLSNHSYGINRGNTNYDYAFWQAKEAAIHMQGNMAKKLNASSYGATGRETIVIFMTDGAPSHYNNECWGSRGIKDQNPDTGKTYPILQGTGINWGNYLTTNTNPYAVELFGLTKGNFYTVGFDLAHGGQADFGTTEAQATALLGGLVSKSANSQLPVYFAETVNDLVNSFSSMAVQIRYAGIDAVVTDEIGTNYTLQTLQKTGTSASTYRGDIGIAPTIEVNSYALNSSGNRTGTPTALEIVTFNTDGTLAYSNVLGSSKNIMSTSNGTTTISAKYFTYTKTSGGKETFSWRIGELGGVELALSYYVYLKYAMGENGGRAAGNYDTNTTATIKYINKNYQYTTLTYPVPSLTWGSVSTTYEYYLVNKAGQPVNRNGQVVSFANRVIVSGPTTKTYNPNTSLKITASAPSGYILYDNSANYTAQGSSGTAHTGKLTIASPSADAKKLGQTGAQTTREVSSTATTFASTRVSFGVLSSTPVTTVDQRLAPNKVVIDYGLPVKTDVRNNNQTPTQSVAGANYSTYTPTVVGLVAYKSGTVTTNFQTNIGASSYTGSCGIFKVQNNEVYYSPTKMLNTVERVFVVVKYTGALDSFYLYDELAIYPATVMYYETNFGSNVFSFTGKGTGANGWSQKQYGNISPTVLTNTQQDNGDVIATNEVTYGYDSHYTNEQYLSMGSSYFVEGVGLPAFNSSTGYPDYDKSANYNEAAFTFTGTGFDIISRTGEKQGAIRVVIYQNNKLVNSKTVLNKSDTKLELYQIPVISVQDLPYGTYEVKIFVNEPFCYADINGGNDPFNGHLDRGCEFYFDAVRIYSPIDTSAETRKVNAVSQEAYECYTLQSEADPTFTELRQFIIDADSYSAGGTMAGAVYLDCGKTDNGTTEDGSDVTVGQTQVYTVGNYASVGPNNETYISAGNAVAFKLSVEDDLPASVDIGVKSADGKASKLLLGYSSAKPGGIGQNQSHDINSATAQFYSMNIPSNLWITESNGSKSVYIIITNASGGILSITDIKYTSATGAKAKMLTLTSDAATVHIANTLLLGGGNLDDSMHSFTYIDTDASLHTLACDICGYSREEAHSYENGLCSCGRSPEQESVLQTPWKLGHTLNLASDIALNYAVSKELVAGFDLTSLCLTVEKDLYEGNTLTGTKTFCLTPVDKGNYYYFTLEGLTAVEMNDLLRATLRGEKDGVTYYSPTDSYSISSYAYTQLGKSNASADLKALCAELLRYGSAAQSYKSYRTDALPNAGLTEEQRALLADLASVPFGDHNQEGSELAQPAVFWLGKALDLNTKISLRYVVDLKNFSGSPAELSLHISYTDAKGETKIAVIGDALPYSSSDTAYAFTFDGLLAAELRTVLTATVYEGQTPVSNTLTYSADTYGNGKTGALLTLCQAVFAYSDAASRYFS